MEMCAKIDALNLDATIDVYILDSVLWKWLIVCFERVNFGTNTWCAFLVVVNCCKSRGNNLDLTPCKYIYVYNVDYMLWKWVIVVLVESIFGSNGSIPSQQINLNCCPSLLARTEKKKNRLFPGWKPPNSVSHVWIYSNVWG